MFRNDDDDDGEVDDDGEDDDDDDDDDDDVIAIYNTNKTQFPVTLMKVTCTSLYNSINTIPASHLIYWRQHLYRR